MQMKLIRIFSTLAQSGNHRLPEHFSGSVFWQVSFTGVRPVVASCAAGWCLVCLLSRSTPPGIGEQGVGAQADRGLGPRRDTAAAALPKSQCLWEAQQLCVGVRCSRRCGAAPGPRGPGAGAGREGGPGHHLVAGALPGNLATHVPAHGDFSFSPLKRCALKRPLGGFRKLREGAWPYEASPALCLLLQLLPQPGGQRLPEPVQQPGEPQVVGPVVAGQEGSALRGRESALCLTVCDSRS